MIFRDWDYESIRAQVVNTTLPEELYKKVLVQSGLQ
jgi:hypothetical protein